MGHGSVRRLSMKMLPTKVHANECNSQLRKGRKTMDGKAAAAPSTRL